MKKQGGRKFSWKSINGEAQITAGRVEKFLKINKRVYPSIWDLRVRYNLSFSNSSSQLSKQNLSASVEVTALLPCVGWPSSFLELSKINSVQSALCFRGNWSVTVDLFGHYYTENFWISDKESVKYQQDVKETSYSEKFWKGFQKELSQKAWIWLDILCLRRI